MIVAAKDGKRLADWFRLAACFASTDRGVPAINGVRVDTTDKGLLRLTATDKYVIGVVTTDLPTEGNGGPHFLPLDDMKRALGFVGKSRNVRLALGRNRAAWTWMGTRYAHGIPADKFPDASKFIATPEHPGAARENVALSYVTLGALGRAHLLAEKVHSTGRMAPPVALDLRGEGIGVIRFTIGSMVHGAVMPVRP